jgi:zinc protease
VTIDTRAFHAAYASRRATLIVAGDAEPESVLPPSGGAWRRKTPPLPAVGNPQAPPVRPARVLVVDRPGAPQTEVRVGHVGPSRQVSDYHVLVTLNALLGGQFSSRINRNLREARGLTYGARTNFDFRVHSGTFSCDTNVQGDATPLVSGLEFEAVVGASRRRR